MGVELDVAEGVCTESPYRLKYSGLGSLLNSEEVYSVLWCFLYYGMSLTSLLVGI